MGRQVTAQYGDSKHQMVLADVAAGAVSGGASDLILWVGDTALTRMTEAKERAIKCLNAYIDNSAIVPAQFGTYHIGIDESVVSVETDGLVSSVAETDVAMIIGSAYYPTGDGSSQLADGIFRQAVDLLLEDRKDA